MKLSTVILPLEGWALSKEKWRCAEELGFHAAYTYDNLSWKRLENRPWFGAVPTLAAASLETLRLKVGTLVTSPNFRNPVPLAKDLLSLDDLSGGRLIVGAGAGGTGSDASVLGTKAWSARERADRFEEFVDLLDELLREPVTTRNGTFYSATEARMLPGTVQRPRPPIYIAATGARGFDLTARFAQGWVTTGQTAHDSATCQENVTQQLEHLRAAFERHGREVSDVTTVLLDGLNDERPLVSLNAFVDWAGRYRELGINELVIHWPEPDSLFDFDMDTFETIAFEGLGQLEEPS
jgi:alkanesulfonate monooxygenase SsuD/methylene tetrahydromethanopterin reductase-like flavin-dependent oxidoreductase (luciferase family)